MSVLAAARRTLPLLAVALTAAATARAAGAQAIVLDFGVSDGGFTPAAAAYNTWGYRPPAQGGTWFTLEPLTQVSLLLSPVFYATGGTSTITLVHQYTLASQFIGTGTVCRDGGFLKLQQGAGAMSALAPTGGHGYDHPIWNVVGNPDPGQDAFCGSVGVPQGVSTTWSFTAAAGTAVRFGFEAAFDSYSSGGAGSTWFLSSVTLDGLSRTAGTPNDPGAPTTTAPEPGTTALVVTGLLGLAGVARRKRRATV